MAPDDKSPSKPPDEPEDPFRSVRLGKLEALRAMGVDPYPVSFARSDEAVALEQRYAALPAGSETQDRVRVAGRIRAIRNSGMFIDLHDSSGKIQVFSHKDYLSAADLALLKLLDIGDLIGVEGRVRRTPRGELTVNATALAMLAKALRPVALLVELIDEIGQANRMQRRLQLAAARLMVELRIGDRVGEGAERQIRSLRQE